MTYVLVTSDLKVWPRPQRSQRRILQDIVDTNTAAGDTLCGPWDPYTTKVRPHYDNASNRKRASSITLPAIAISSRVLNSSGQWLFPFGLRTKIIAVFATDAM